jgi:hypothetical protein
MAVPACPCTPAPLQVRKLVVKLVEASSAAAEGTASVDASPSCSSLGGGSPAGAAATTSTTSTGGGQQQQQAAGPLGRPGVPRLSTSADSSDGAPPLLPAASPRPLGGGAFRDGAPGHHHHHHPGGRVRTSLDDSTGRFSSETVHLSRPGGAGTGGPGGGGGDDLELDLDAALGELDRELRPASAAGRPAGGAHRGGRGGRAGSCGAERWGGWGGGAVNSHHSKPTTGPCGRLALHRAEPGPLRPHP